MKKIIDLQYAKMIQWASHFTQWTYGRTLQQNWLSNVQSIDIVTHYLQQSSPALYLFPFERALPILMFCF